MSFGACVFRWRRYRFNFLPGPYLFGCALHRTTGTLIFYYLAGTNYDSGRLSCTICIATVNNVTAFHIEQANDCISCKLWCDFFRRDVRQSRQKLFSSLCWFLSLAHAHANVIQHLRITPRVLLKCERKRLSSALRCDLDVIDYANTRKSEEKTVRSYLELFILKKFSSGIV